LLLSKRKAKTPLLIVFVLSISLTKRGPVDFEMEMNSRDRPMTPSIPDYTIIKHLIPYIALLVDVGNHFEIRNRKVLGVLDESKVIARYEAAHIGGLSEIVLYTHMILTDDGDIQLGGLAA
jgi:hypothetical protein